MSNIVTNDGLVRFVKTDHAVKYIEEIYKNAVELDMAWMVELRYLGMYQLIKGGSKPGEGSTPLQLMALQDQDWQKQLARWVSDRLLGIAPSGLGAFMAPALLDDRRAKDKSVKRLVSVCADFDSGDPDQALKDITARLGVRPTFVCHSGGIIKDNGKPKLHVHWRLDEPADMPWMVAYIREVIALNHQADTSFKRIPQVIRVPGALYDKTRDRCTEIIEFNDIDTSIDQWEEAFNIDWDNLHPLSMHNKKQERSLEERQERMRQLQLEQVEEGRTEDTRFDRFSEYAGHQIRQARFQHQTEAEALQSVQIWVQEKMVPAWPLDRVRAEFHALLNRDKVNNPESWGEHNKPPITIMNTPVPANQQPVSSGENTQLSPHTEQNAQNNDVSQAAEEEWSLKLFQAGLLYAGNALPERHLIENFLVHGSTFALVADGGIGKTYVSLELALRAACGPDYRVNGNPNTFMGFEVLEKCVTLVFTVEDGQHDIHRRLCAIDPDGQLRAAAGQDCMIVPVQEQIMHGLTLVERDKQGNWVSSKAWNALNGYIEQLMSDPAMQGRPLLVVIDTYSATHHGDENSATGTNEWFRAAAQLRKFEATLLVTHHVRKSDPKQEIRTPSDMRAAVRGSSAFLNACRGVFGIWEMPNSDSILKELPYEKGTKLFNMGILKNNTGINWDDRTDPRYPEPMITLRRLAMGQLIYDGLIHDKRIELANNKEERIEGARRQLKAAMVHAVRWYSEGGWPLSRSSFEKNKGSFLPPKIRDMARQKEIVPALDELIENGTLKQLKIKGMGAGMILDVPDGAYITAKIKTRRDDAPNMQWSHFRYDQDNEEYIENENMQDAMDL